MFELKRKNIIILLWLPLMLNLFLMIYLLLNTIPWDEGEMKNTLENIIVKASSCFILLVSVVFQVIALTATSSRAQIYDQPENTDSEFYW